jgi:predicted dehydrogenase
VIKIALIGCGLIVNRQHIKAYKEVKEKAPDLFEITAICDLEAKRARKIANQVSAFQKTTRPRIYTDHKQMMEKELLDAISIATPHFAHHGPTVDALNAGVNVLIEKPFAITVKAGQKMIAAANKNKRVLACIEPYRRTPVNRMVDWAINKAHLIGDPRFFLYQRVIYNLGVVVGTPWRHQKIQSGGGWVFDGEVHYMDFLHMVFGDVDEVYAKTRNFEPTRYLDTKAYTNPIPSDVEDTAFAVLTFESGVIGSFIWTHAAVGEPVSIKRYYGSEGSLDQTDLKTRQNLRTKNGKILSLNELQKRFTESISEKEKEKLFPLGMTNPYSISIYDFLDALTNKRPPEIPGRNALVAQAICDAILESDAAGKAVKVKDVLEGRVETFQHDIDEYWKI